MAPSSLTRGSPACAWVTAAQQAFLDGYAEGSAPTRATSTLLAAFESDKAMHEVVYEARNRPGWVEIPLAAVRRSRHTSRRIPPVK